MKLAPLIIDPHLTRPDTLVLKTLLADIDHGNVQLQAKLSDREISHPEKHGTIAQSNGNGTLSKSTSNGDQATIDALEAWNNPEHKSFEPSVFATWDLPDVKVPATLDRIVLQPYIKWARTIVRKETDVLMLTQLILYFTTSVPSALYLYYHFSYLHAFFHILMQLWYTGTYTLMMHQHIHMGGILAKKYAWIDACFPYITDPLMGHTWNSYFFHHVKHHHIESNGPDDLSSTLLYQRDEISSFLHYVGRFFFFVWLDLPLYFLRKNKPVAALKTAASELGTYAAICLLAIYGNSQATVFVYVLPLLTLRLGLMVGNWGQHAFVDEVDPDSDFRSSITLIDVSSNRYCYNDGYHTSHHLNPRRHWREHPVAFIKQKDRYAQEDALVFRNIDYIMITIKLLQKDYMYLAERMVPLGHQMDMTVEQRATLLKTKARRFTRAEIEQKFPKKQNL
ncbi:hypothetical protein P152DRAFT_507695 [Eremomyces bilateralis CBS 781.70]|uniref:Fatty acid desaturase domain-containing protein n=1 Tax=Eremomyces bilateralis CBS 781.70 TaxID=1392243 RepID=A0A6G1G1K3_9PEZI|nr:uncharacterized protein P152DRAFT_507695 [Eremomyces bilateralis CBS 781.70]KAF1811862.1 hypothetical protein P152DRAFT_507695 [Eremomyces bilateralis CBS 781.70]